MKEQTSTEIKSPPALHTVLEAADRLTPEEQAILIEVLNRRFADRQRAEIAADIREAEREWASGVLRRTSPHEIMKEILS